MQGGGLQSIARRVNPYFGVFFTMIIYMAIGPFFGIPRTATVSYEIGVVPFLPDGIYGCQLATCILYDSVFSIDSHSCTESAKLVDRIGKVLTPILFIVIGALAVKSIVTPMGK